MRKSSRLKEIQEDLKMSTYGKRMESGTDTHKSCWKSWVYCWSVVAAPFVYLFALPFMILGIVLYPCVCPCKHWCPEGCWSENFYGFVRGMLCCVCDMHKQLFDRPALD